MKYNRVAHFIDEFDSYLTSDSSSDKKKDAKFLISNYVLNREHVADKEIEYLDLSELEDFVLHIIEELKKDIQFSKLADFYFALRYQYGFVKNNLGESINIRLSVELLSDLAKLHNPYAIKYLSFCRKILFNS
ncbi:TPA: hypothetical protein ACGPA6_001290 [Streptococcus suis]